MNIEQVIEILKDYPQDKDIKSVCVTEEITTVEFKNSTTKGTKTLTEDQIKHLENKSRDDWHTLKEGDRICVYSKKFCCLGNFEFEKLEHVGFKYPNGCLVLIDTRGVYVRFYQGLDGMRFIKK